MEDVDCDLVSLVLPELSGVMIFVLPDFKEGFSIGRIEELQLG